MIIPNDQTSFYVALFWLVFRCHIKSHCLIDTWNYLILNVRIWKFKLSFWLNLNVATGLRLKPTFLLIGNPRGITLFFGDIFSFEKIVPIDHFGEISPNIQAVLSLFLFLIIVIWHLIWGLVEASTGLKKIAQNGHALIGILLIGLIVRVLIVGIGMIIVYWELIVIGTESLLVSIRIIVSLGIKSYLRVEVLACGIAGSAVSISISLIWIPAWLIRDILIGIGVWTISEVLSALVVKT